MDRVVRRILTLVALSATASAITHDAMAGQAAVPVASGSVARDAEGRPTVRAIRIAAPLRIDGRLDEEPYSTFTPITDFLQTMPRQGVPPTERTEAWVLFDDTNFYVAARCWDSSAPEDWIANEMRRDTGQLRQNDHFGVMLDTFNDRRNGMVFYANPLGARADSASADEGGSNSDWNPVWEVRTGRFDGGWTIEMAIPFKSIRYRSGPGQVWGFNMRRSIRRKNEWAHLHPVPPSVGGSTGFLRISEAGQLVGLDLPPASRNVEVKPYVIGGVATDRLAAQPFANDLDRDFGVDAKYGITANLTADFTYNTDFSQVEIDEQQVNLTRFSLQFPEKREFFLEGRGLFEFGRGGAFGGGGGGGGGGDAPLLFYSRRIGLNRNRVVPIDAGGRITGKVGRFGIGVMNIQTADERESASPATNFTVLRVKRDVLRRSSIGLMFTNRSESAVLDGANQAIGADASFGFFENVSVGGYYAATFTGAGGDRRDSASYQGRFNYGGDRYGVSADFLSVEEGFNPEVGFVRRDDFRRMNGSARFSPRPASGIVRQYSWEAGIDYLETGAGILESRQHSARFNAEFDNSDQASLDVTRNFERLFTGTTIAGLSMPAGAYGFSDLTARYSLGQQRRVSGTLSVHRGEFYDGTITAIGYGGARVSVTNQLSVEPNISINRVERADSRFTTTVLRARTDYGFTPRMFASGLLQYSSAERVFSSNVRFRWEYLPGSELFAVYTDERDTIARRPDSRLRNRAFVVKVNRLLRF